MPRYKLILTMQDSFGMTKEIEAGVVDAAEYELTDDEIQKVVKTMDKTFATEEEAKQWDIETQTSTIEKLPEVIETDEEIQTAIEQNVDTIKYKGFTD
jgi:gamma-glutamyl:cysteine ligase YbdK (ATP-grasp superfamily)